jgi:hypothetical protein
MNSHRRSMCHTGTLQAKLFCCTFSRTKVQNGGGGANVNLKFLWSSGSDGDEPDGFYLQTVNCSSHPLRTILTLISRLGLDLPSYICSLAYSVKKM